MGTLSVSFIIATLPRMPRDIRPGEYHYPRLEDADKIKDAVGQKYKLWTTAVDNKKESVAHLFNVDLDDSDVANWENDLLKVRDNIVDIVRSVQSGEQHLRVYIKDVDAITLRHDYGIDILSASLNGPT